MMDAWLYTDLGSHQASILANPLRQRPTSLNYGFSGEKADLRACAEAIRRGSKSFHIASLLLPIETRKAAYALYAFCRHSDDLVDDPRAGKEALVRLRLRLDLIYEGTPAAYACDRAFARTVHEHAIPKTVALALLDGFAMDLDQRRFVTIGELKGYAACVAATVGIMMALVMKTGDTQALARAADLGIAMQLTNIARDVGEDARNGRLYLPFDWLEDAGICPAAFLRDPQFSPALAEVIGRLLSEADHHYQLGHAGIACLPDDCRHAIRTAALVYQEIGATIAFNGYDSISQRASTSLAKKLALVFRARRASATELLGDPALLGHVPDAATESLVEASATAYSTLKSREADSYQNEVEDSSIDRFTTIMMQLQAKAREESRFRRLAAQRKVASLV